MILDIGCGRKKIAGAIGIDYSCLSDADISLNLNVDKFPFDDNSVDFAYSSHTLEHLTIDGFFNVMSEVYRVLKPDCQFQIVVPYFLTSINLANPFHNNNICFNEHTFRFFSSDPECAALPRDFYSTPSCPQWGLRYSANCELGIEFETLRVSTFNYKTVDDESDLGNCGFDRVDQICYTLKAIKPLPLRPDSGPISPDIDLTEFLARQLDYLSSQIPFLTEFKLFDEIEKSNHFLSVYCKGDQLYVVNNILFPINFLILELDYLINCNQVKIDRKIR